MVKETQRLERKSNRIIITVCVTAFLLRLVLSPYLTYERDVASWIGWSERLLEIGFKKFYSFGWCDYLPGYLYILWFLGKVRQFLDGLALSVSPYILYKLPAILADVATVCLIYFLVKKWASKKIAILASLAYALNPAIFANSTFWGQIDSVNTLFYLLTLITLIKRKWVLSSLFLAISCLIKPQGIVLIPLIALILLKEKNWKLFIIHYSLFIILFVLAFIPFLNSQFSILNSQFFQFILSRFQAALDQYPYTSLNAFNFWAVGKMWWRKDSLAFLGLPYQLWGLLMFGVIYIFCLWLLWRSFKVGKKKQFSIFNFQFSISLLAIIFSALFLFPTRVHERHLFSALPFLLLSATFIPRLWWVYGWYSVAYVLNLVFAYVWLTNDFREIFSPAVVNVLSLLNLAVFVFLLRNIKSFITSGLRGWLAFRSKIGICEPSQKRHIEEKLFELGFASRTKKILLFLLVSIALFTRFFRLSVPQKLVFDEVYHGFTAGEFAKGNKEAWEWWTTPPPDVAYEWTHPPLAKLLMAGAIKVFGYNSFGWRFASAVMGVAAVVFLYLLAKALFNNFFIAFVSAFLMTFDFMPFVMSRIAMNDIFFVGFMLGSLYFFVRFIAKQREKLTPKDAKNYLLPITYYLLPSGFLWGCALASKWTGLYAVFIFAPFLIGKLKREIGKLKNWVTGLLGYFVSFVVIPISVYLASYLPFFFQNHSWEQFIHLQKQMWWYHTGLKATHPFTSSWWSWPLNFRPVWLFVDYAGDKIANIYCFGNPLIWWTGLGAILYLVYQLGHRLQVIGYRWQLLFIILGYIAFFLPWSLSPRIMFIYHYFPSLPFLYMAIAYTLNKILGYKDTKILKFVICYLLFVICLFIFFYPHLAAVHVPKDFSKFYFWLRSWR